uniref:Mab-21 domain containing 2 n=1 Tax=Tetraodon nigroviridis TaxID=99883 RepID=H3D0X3_TETNG
SAGSVGNSPTAAGRTPSGAAPELDFRSAARMEDLNRLIQEFSKHDQREYDDQRALEIHTAKDFIFSMLGMVQKLDQKLPVANEYLLLSGGVREGVVDIPHLALSVYARGTDYDMDFTLLVPALKLGGGENRRALRSCYSRTCCRSTSCVAVRASWEDLLWPLVSATRSSVKRKKAILSDSEDEEQLDKTGGPCVEQPQETSLEEADSAATGGHAPEEQLTPLGGSSASTTSGSTTTSGPWRSTRPRTSSSPCWPTLVADWFHQSISLVLLEVQKKPQRGMPRVEKVEKNGTVISVILGVGSSRMLYDIVPVVSFKGWPAVAQSWLMENHFWDGKITEEEVISGFYLLPACSFKGRKENEWRLSFARSEVQLKKCISSSLMGAYQACKAIIIKLLSRPKAVSPYHLRSIMLWACDRLPAAYLGQDDFSAHFLLGLIDDLQHCLVNKACPNYFIPQCNMLEHLSDEAAVLHARKLSSVRSDPAEHLRTTIEHAKAANR